MFVIEIEKTVNTETVGILHVCRLQFKKTNVFIALYCSSL